MIMPFASNVAWFKLSESVARNERERAFTSYRLLAYSINSDSFRLQILGDLHVAFTETALAIDAYQKAFYMCEMNNDTYGMFLANSRIKECGVEMPCGTKYTHFLYDDIKAPEINKRDFLLIEPVLEECNSHHYS